MQSISDLRRIDSTGCHEAENVIALPRWSTDHSVETPLTVFIVASAWGSVIACQTPAMIVIISNPIDSSVWTRTYATITASPPVDELILHWPELHDLTN